MGLVALAEGGSISMSFSALRMDVALAAELELPKRDECVCSRSPGTMQTPQIVQGCARSPARPPARPAAGEAGRAGLRQLMGRAETCLIWVGSRRGESRLVVACEE